MIGIGIGRNERVLPAGLQQLGGGRPGQRGAQAEVPPADGRRQGEAGPGGPGGGCENPRPSRNGQKEKKNKK